MGVYREYVFIGGEFDGERFEVEDGKNFTYLVKPLPMPSLDEVMMNTAPMVCQRETVPYRRESIGLVENDRPVYIGFWKDIGGGEWRITECY